MSVRKSCLSKLFGTISVPCMYIFISGFHMFCNEYYLPDLSIKFKLKSPVNKVL
jgi:hypothetical protein